MVTDNDYLVFLKTAKVVLFPLSTIAQCIVNNVLNNASLFSVIKKERRNAGANLLILSSRKVILSLW